MNKELKDQKCVDRKMEKWSKGREEKEKRETGLRCCFHFNNYFTNTYQLIIFSSLLTLPMGRNQKRDKHCKKSYLENTLQPFSNKQAPFEKLLARL